MPVPNTPNYYAVADPTFQRAMRNILSITQAPQTVVTTTYDGLVPADHEYFVGMYVRLYIPPDFGMVQANNLQGKILTITPTTFTLDLDTSSFDPFVIPTLLPGLNATPAQVVPVGSVAEILTAATFNVLS